MKYITAIKFKKWDRYVSKVWKVEDFLDIQFINELPTDIVRNELIATGFISKHSAENRSIHYLSSIIIQLTGEGFVFDTKIIDGDVVYLLQLTPFESRNLKIKNNNKIKIYINNFLFYKKAKGYRKLHLDTFLDRALSFVK